ncbi:uracil-5--methyltransferase [Viridothelium virens]|uniref:tRNA (uracil(54)-C(5))-methyltransferase n=1 Tax=Viridothelium virens TaxID=1048519 RepID=A0A6A6HQ12_VIRVR|nr:uracil-5--methyltransferase [Viridothelium virens]
MSPSAANAHPVESNGTKKRPFNKGKSRFEKKSKRQKILNAPGKDGSNEDVLLTDVLSMLRLQGEEDASTKSGSIGNTVPASTEPHELPEELEVSIEELSSTGDGLALHPSSNQVLVVPFAIPGDKARVKIFPQNKDRPFLLTDLVRIVTASSQRDDNLITCRYFAECSGCQFQMLSYPDQLAHKKRIIEKAYRNFSGFSSDSVPQVGDTIGSPLQYGYRTKLTPHFDAPPGTRKFRRKGETPKWSEVPPIGFMKKGTRATLDIEDCPIGTDAVRTGMQVERKRVAEQLDTYKRGATLCLRESTERILKSSESAPEKVNTTNVSSPANGKDAIIEDRGQYIHKKTCITDQNAITTEYVDDFVFTNPAGAFFQNNNSILPIFASYIRSNILPPDSDPPSPKVTNLIDAYSGSGLFTITLSSLFENSVGIEISQTSIASANKNAKLNNLDPSHATFRAADASDLFGEVTFAPEETAVVIDPPRKGCDEKFLRQLLRYGPTRIVYVSCNVHTQARDVGILVGGMEGSDGGKGIGKGAYEIESLQGFDFFPQTSHVEGVAVLRKSAEMGSRTSLD